MFNILKRKKSPEVPAAPSQNKGLFSRLKESLAKTRDNLGNGLATLFLGKKELTEGVFETLETQLLLADVGIEATQQLIGKLTQKLKRRELDNVDAALKALQEDMNAMLAPCQVPLQIPADKKPFLILMVGINGSGKTTTIGKLAQQFKQQGKSLLLAAGDTFRAAATEQLQVWGERNQVPVISQQAGADSASVIFDAYSAAKARGLDLVLADTAGRLHTQTHLMVELQKIKRVLNKLDPETPQEILLVLDASIGQNALTQARQFHQALGITGLVLTKLDGTAKGGIIFAIANELRLPIRYIGIGEGIEDLRPFDADEFVKALF